VAGDQTAALDHGGDALGQGGQLERVAVDHHHVGPLPRLQGAELAGHPSSSAAEEVVAARTSAGAMPPLAISSSSAGLRPCGVTPLSVPWPP
jgi:hypothetical protein